MDSGETLLYQGVELMLAGIGSVFVFLVMLVFATRVMSWGAVRFSPTPAPVPATEATENADDIPEGHLAAVAAAVAQFRKDHRKARTLSMQQTTSGGSAR